MLARTWLGYETDAGWVMRLMLAGTWLWDSCWLGHGYGTHAGWDMDGS